MLVVIWQSAIGYAIGASAVVALLLYRLGTLVPGLAQVELAAKSGSDKLSSIINNPLNAPHKLAQFATQKLGNHGALTLRLASVLFAAGFVLLFYYIVKAWHTRRIALLTTALFASSSWFLHVARLATPDILLLGLLAALAFGTWIQRTKRFSLTVLTGGLLVSILIYMPGFVWFVGAAIIWQREKAWELIKNARLAAIAGFTVVVVLLAPLGLALLRQPELIKQLAGLPAESLPSIHDIALNTARIPLQLVLRGPNNPILWLGRLPLLDIFSLTMASLGCYAYYFRRKLDRTKTIAGCAVVGMVLIAIGGQNKMPVLMPLVYLLAAGGISLMLQRWFTVFPRNPLARTIGVILISLAVAASSYYHLNHYFVAWPQSPKTKSVFLAKV